MISDSRPPRPGAGPLPGHEGADADLFDYAKIRDHLQYVVHSIARHWLLALTVLVGVVSACLVALAVLPKTYHCEIKIQAQRNVVISTLAGLSRSWDADLPTRAAADIVLRHDNLVSLVRKTDLASTWDASRAPLLRVKDGLLRLMRGDLPPDLKEEMLVGTLEQKLWVRTTEDTVTIGVDWPDAKMAYRLIQAAHSNFLEARQYNEVSAVSEAIGLLESRALESRERVLAALERVHQLRPQKPVKPHAETAPIRVVKSAPPVDPELERLRGQLQAKRQVIAEMEDIRRRRIAETSSRLADLKQVYSEFHPAVIDLEQSLQQEERQESPQLTALRQEYRELEARYDRRGGPALDAPESLSSARLPAEAIQISRSVSEEVESPEVEQAKADLKHEIGLYSSMAEKIDQAKLEMDTQRAAFAYRYGVLRPAGVPEAPDKPKSKVIIPVAVLLGLILGVLAATLADLRSGVLLERWQVQRQLDLEILGETGAP